jgi:hypothetical protein
MGLVVAPLTSLVLERVAPQYAAAASGVFSTAQEVGNALGIAIIGVVFFDVAEDRPGPHGMAEAFSTSLLVQAGISVAVAALLQLLPGRAKSTA